MTEPENTIYPIRTVFPRGGMQVVTFAKWEQRLVIAHGSPKNIKGIADLARKEIRIVSRGVGAGTGRYSTDTFPLQVLANKGPSAMTRSRMGHLAAALAVSTGQADCCVATRAAAKTFGIFFRPLATERYDLVFPRRNRSILRRKTGRYGRL